MKIRILKNIQDIEKIIEQCEILANENKCNLPFQRIQLPLIWWKHFNSCNSIDFGATRGRNFFGKKSWLSELNFIVIEDNKHIIGISLLFKSKVLYGGKNETIEIISFSPDTVIFYFQDFVIAEQKKGEIIKKLFEGINTIIDNKKTLFMITNIHMNSSNLPYIRKEFNKKRNKGWYTSEGINCKKGGLYPWNLNDIISQLSAMLELNDMDQKVHAEIINLIKIIEKNKFLLIRLSATRQNIENQLKNVLKKLSNKEKYTDYIENIKNALETRPIKYPYLELPKNIEQFIDSLSKSKRYYYNRYMKKFYNSGGAFENIEPKDITDNDLEQFYYLHECRWGDHSAAINSKTKQYFMESSKEMARAGYFRLIFAIYGHKRIASIALYDIINRREFYYSGRSMEENKLRAGKLLVYYSILDAIKKNFKIYDFGYGGDEYKFEFTNNYQTVSSFILADEGLNIDFERIFTGHEIIKFDDPHY